MIPKSRAALSRYGHQLVIGNDLHRRKYEVVFVERKAPPPSGSFFTPRKGTGDNRLGGVETPPTVDVEQGGHKGMTTGEEYAETWLRLDELRQGVNGGATGEVEIEELIVQELVRRHETWIDAGQKV